jgi:predicted transcriptional regulator YheO
MSDKLQSMLKRLLKSTANEVRRATKQAIIKELTEYNARNKETFKALMMCLKDTGLRVIDLLGLNCDVSIGNLEKEIIPFTIRTEKTGYIAKTFFGKDAIQASREYIEARQKGSRNLDPETITKDTKRIQQLPRKAHDEHSTKGLIK